MRTFSSKNHENFDVIGTQKRFAASFPDKMLWRNRPAFSSKEKSRGYSVHSYSRIGSFERALKFPISRKRPAKKCIKMKNYVWGVQKSLLLPLNIQICGVLARARVSSAILTLAKNAVNSITKINT